MKRGQTVICIDDSAGWIDGALGLVQGHKYTILDVITNGDVVVSCGDCGAWSTKRFRLIKNEWVEEILNKIIIELEQVLILN